MSCMNMVKFTLVTCALVMGYGASARAALNEYDFTGHITEEDTSGPLKDLLNPNFNTDLDVVSGYLRYDASTPDTTPGVFDLPGAIFHAVFAGGTVDATGVTATVSVNQDLIVFRTDVPVAEFLPTVISSATMSLGFQTFTDGYFNLTSLPVTVPPNDKTLGFAYTAGGVDYGASTDTNLVVTARTVPEPSPLAVLGLGLASLVFASSRKKRSDAG